jgi:acetyl esterase/lipase
MPSPQHEAIVAGLQSQPRPAAPPDLAQQRAGVEAMMAPLAPGPEVKQERVQAGGVPGSWISAPGARADRVVLYLHGGGYILGSVASHAGLVARISRAGAARCLALDYRLAPEHPFPAAVEDATAAYRWLLRQGTAPSQIAIAGDSAGGGLTLATLVALRDAGDPLPAAGICMSPWTDLALTGESAQGGVDDPLIPASALTGMALPYLGKTDARTPTASSLYANLRGLPPLLIQVGTREVLYSDSTRIAEKAKAAGVDVTLEVGEGLIHVWQLFGDAVPESADAVARIGTFLRRRIA